MVSQLLGPSLEDLLDICNPGLPKEERCMSIVTVFVVGIMCLRALRKLHCSGYVHRDVKPENLLMGSNNAGKEALSTLFLFCNGTNPLIL